MYNALFLYLSVNFDKWLIFSNSIWRLLQVIEKCSGGILGGNSKFKISVIGSFIPFKIFYYRSFSLNWRRSFFVLLDYMLTPYIFPYIFIKTSKSEVQMLREYKYLTHIGYAFYISVSVKKKHWKRMLKIRSRMRV